MDSIHSLSNNIPIEFLPTPSIVAKPRKTNGAKSCKGKRVVASNSIDTHLAKYPPLVPIWQSTVLAGLVSI